MRNINNRIFDALYELDIVTPTSSLLRVIFFTPQFMALRWPNSFAILFWFAWLATAIWAAK